MAQRVMSHRLPGALWAVHDWPSRAIVYKGGLPQGLPFSDMVFTELRRRMDLDYTMHGFRTSFRAWATEATEYPHEMLELALAHIVRDETVRAYMRTSMFEKRRQLMEDWATYLRSTEAAVLPAASPKPQKTPKNRRNSVFFRIFRYFCFHFSVK